MIQGTDHPPEPVDHPILHRAFLESSTPRARWAAEFAIPRSDPRYLDATEEDVLRDLLVLQYTRGRARMAGNRAAAALAYAEAHADSLREQQEALREWLKNATNPTLAETRPAPRGRISTIRGGRPR